MNDSDDVDFFHKLLQKSFFLFFSKIVPEEKPLNFL